MAWLSGLADKAENLLNKIDQNTAAVLNKDKYELPQPGLTEVTWIPQPREEEFLTFLNSPTASPRRTTTDMLISPSTPSSLLVEHPMDNTDSVSELSIHSGRSSPGLTHTSVEVPDIEDPELELEVNGLLTKHETMPLENILTNSLMIEKTVDINFETEPNIEQESSKHENVHKETELPNVMHSTNGQYVNRDSNQVDKVADSRDKLMRKQDTDYQKEIVALNAKLQSLQFENMQLSKQSVDLQSIVEKNKLELISVRSELEQHRARALRTLQEKEKLITELKTNGSSGMDDAIMMELNQLRQERDSLREENQQACEQLKIVREELANTDLKLEKIRQQSTETKLQAQEIFTGERRRRLDAEEDARLHAEEIRSLKDELLRQRNGFTLQLQKQDTEISRLRSQLSATSTPNSEVESRLTSLTQTLVMKQQALENLTTERNALRLQLEKIEDEYRCTAGNNRRNISYNNMNDTDDAKAQVPTFFMETPFDTGVTRRVKRAYSSLDAISIRTGVFLRRYPLARILVLIYMALLQFWVLVVLVVFSQSPETH